MASRLLPPIPPRALAVGAATALLLSACSGTRWGDQLSRSFPLPGAPASPRSASSAAGGSAVRAPAALGNGSPAPAAKTASPRAAASTTAVGPPGTPPGGKVSTGQTAIPPALRSPGRAPQPAPYRLTIKLPAADPSAPAEGVTEALRAAGVAFEVETIERIHPAGQGQVPVATPAPAPR